MAGADAAPARTGAGTSPVLRILRLLSFGATVAGILFAAWVWWLGIQSIGNPADVRIYLSTPIADPYSGWILGAGDAYQYSPAFLQAVQPLHLVPEAIVIAAWRFVLLAIVVALAGPLTIPVLLWGPVLSEINAGNVNLLIAAAIAAGFRWPATWAFVLHTKLTPAVGLLWFMVRREWRSLATVLAATVAIALVSAILAPGLWIEWLQLLVSNAGQGAGVTTFPFWIPLWIRLPVAAVMVVLAARAGQRWVVPIAAVIAAPVLYFPTQSIALGALPDLRVRAGRWLERRWARRGSDSADHAAPQASQPAPEGGEVPPQVVR